MNSAMSGYNGIMASTGNFTNLTANYIPKHSASGLTNSLIYDNGTNVSIGEQNSGVLFNVVGYTTYPVARFAQGANWNDSNYALYVDGYSYLNGFGINADDGQRGLYAKAGRQLGFATDNNVITFTTQTVSERMRIAADGNVGIGTTNPGNRLTVSKTLGTSDYISVAQHYLQFKIINNLGIYGSRALEMGLLDDGTGVIQANEGGVGYNYLSLNPAGGNVGIGTTNPNYKLDVNGGIRASSFVHSSGTADQLLVANGTVINKSELTTYAGTFSSDVIDLTNVNGAFNVDSVNTYTTYTLSNNKVRGA